MTPQRRNTSQLGLNLTDDANLQIADGLHLTDAQMNGLLASADGSDPAAESHLQTCAACAEELAGLREALALFQRASIAHSDHELARLRSLDRPAHPVLPTRRPYSQTLFWVTASAVLMAAILPIEMHWQRTLPAPTGAAAAASTRSAESESDEALLEDVNRDLSRSVPASMQALDDPTGTTGSSSATSSDTLTQSTTQTSTQRKD